MSETPQPGQAPGTAVPTCYRHTDRETWIRCQRCDRPICPDCMHEASVGFQCPSCVREGAKSTRSGLTAYGGNRSANPAATSIGLISINVAVFLAILLTGGRSSRLVGWLALRPEGACLATSQGPGRGYPAVDSAAQCARMPDGAWLMGALDGAPWQMVTSMFTHVEIWHIGFNMLALWVLGPQLEAAFGRVRFLALYLLSGLAGSMAVLWLSGPYTQVVGASTAIFGLLGALLVVAFKVGGDIRGILTWLGINVVITVLGSSFISWQGHLGGLVGGLLVSAVLVYAPRSRRTTWQVAGLTLLAALLVAGFLTRDLL